MECQKAYIPMLVGKEEEKMEKIMVHIKILNHESFKVLLEMAEREFGYKHEGLLRIPCSVTHFMAIVNFIGTLLNIASSSTSSSK